jgi:hypothetical protein
MKHGDRSLKTPKSTTHRREGHQALSFTQVQGPRGEVKPLLPAFLYYDAIPREEYKSLIKKL